MGFISTSLLAFGMSTDSFAASLSKGARVREPKIVDALRAGIIFGGVEALAPLLGWYAGLFASGFIQEIDHWFAYVILCSIGIKLIYDSFVKQDRDEVSREKVSVWVMFLTALATSIDAFAVGISLAFVDYNIVLAALSIGVATFTMVNVGMMAGHIIGQKAGLYAERIGGLILVLIGHKILFEHLGLMTL